MAIQHQIFDYLQYLLVVDVKGYLVLLVYEYVELIMLKDLIFHTQFHANHLLV